MCNTQIHQVLGYLPPTGDYQVELYGQVGSFTVASKLCRWRIIAAIVGGLVAFRKGVAIYRVRWKRQPS